MKKEMGLIAAGAVAALVMTGAGVVSAGDIQTDGKVVSTTTSGPPLAVSSTDKVDNLNADQVDGLEAREFALDGDLQSVETMLVALQVQVDALGLALVPRTGQTTCWDVAGTVTTCGTGIGLGQDGDLQLGVNWPIPRFTKNGDGTVTDNLTTLVWLENADCFGPKSWADALAAANGLFDGSTNDPGGSDCGLSDGSVAGQWRLPNMPELHSLRHYAVFFPAVPDTVGTGQWSEGDPFSGVGTSSVQSNLWWSSSTYPILRDWAQGVYISYGGSGGSNKVNNWYVWPVRSGQ